MPASNPHELVLSYTRVRTALGLLGMALPLVLLIGGLVFEEDGLAPSISDFYHTTYRDIFVGTMIAIGVFLISYRGYAPAEKERLPDDVLATIAGIGAFGTAFFPNELPPHILVAYGDLADPIKWDAVPATTVFQRMVGIQYAPYFHYVFATLFFGSLALFCFVKFARHSRVVWRRRLYLTCGWIILATLALAFVASMLKIFGPDDAAVVVFVKSAPIIFWLEAIGVWAFGLSWLVKGKADYRLAAMAVELRRISR
ncbi:hypothetical protein [Shimia ponticola]|uniref:hypothetical protein n=1 Tax=Shimia ponticola TaxID=2582893 RepID=UPI0011BE7A50|nr:hypothetical protein [Shimia ponticola]